MKWWSLGGAIACEVTATLSLRAATDDPVWYVLVVAGYCASFAFLARALRLMPVGVAYGIWGAAGILLTAVAATVLFGDPMTPLMALGMALVIAGVVIVELGSHPRIDPVDERDDGVAAR
ncbi:DMT family transporter [Rhodococcus sp. NPDC003382]